MSASGTAADWFEKGNQLYSRGQFAQAMAAYRRAIQDQPGLAQAHNNLANALVQSGDLDAAVNSYRKAIALDPNLAEAHHNLGAILQRLGRWEESARAYQEAGGCNPDLPAEVFNQLGIVLSRCGKLESAAEAFGQAIAKRAEFPEALNNLANIFHQLNKPAQAIECYRRAGALRPDSAEIFNNLGNVLKETGQLDHALAAQHRAAELRGDYADAYNNLANTLKDTRRLDQAIACYDAALAIDPTHAIAHSGKVYTLHFHPDSTPQSLAAAHKEWADRHAAPLPRYSQHLNLVDPNRRLRIGYVSPDFREHVVGRFLRPLLANHDHRQFEIVAYASVKRPDSHTPWFKQHVDVWQDVATITDDQLAARILADQIDILVDLTMHMAGSRLLMFARKPAPIQLTYLAYCSTTGLEAMDYRFTDGYLDSPDQFRFYSEKSLSLKSYWCYEASSEIKGVQKECGPITFGCLNNFCKISDATIATWAKLMLGVDDSRLIIHAHAGTHRKEFVEHFIALGVSSERIRFVPFASLSEYLRSYSQIDIALDPFPYAGGTTTCDALWMGVPVVSLAGGTAVSRAGKSILNQIGLGEFVTDTREQYIETAVHLAADQSRLRYLRENLRARMAGSSLMNACQFAKDVEQQYREIWKDWCEGQ